MSSSVISLLKICTCSSHLQQVHAQIIRKGLEQDHVLISQFMVCLSRTLSGVLYSRSVFDRVLLPNACLWNVLIRAFCEKSGFGEAVSVFVRMKREERFADRYTFPPLMKSCASEIRVREGMAFHGSALRCGADLDVFVRTSLIDFYGKCNDVASARKLFDEMPEKNVVSWTAMVNGYVVSGDLVQAKKLFDEMPHRNVASWNAMMDGFVKLGDLDKARIIFNEMPEKNVISFTTMIDGYAKSGDMASARHLFDRAPARDVFAWSALISGYAQNGQIAEAMNIFVEMSSSRVKPDERVVVGLITACSKRGDPELAKRVENHVLRLSSVDPGSVHVSAALVDMNAKCGNLERARELFEGAPKRDLVSYCSMMNGLSLHGRGREAVRLFRRMVNEGLTADGAAFTVVLTACSRAGLVSEGLRLFQRLTAPSPEHRACLVDLLSRSGRLREAYEVLRSAPPEARGSGRGALLGACKLHGDAELAELVGAESIVAEPRSCGGYVILSQVYAERERWSEVSLLRDRMKEEGLRKVPGRSWISSRGRV